MPKIEFKNSLFLISLFLLKPSFLIAQTAEVKSIRGVVQDTKSAPLSYVNVFLQNSYDGGVSDSRGYFEILTKKTGRRFLLPL